MAVDTKIVSDRREIHYNSLEDLLQDIRQLASGEVHTIGNWSFGQIMTHLAIAYNGSMDGLKLHVPWHIKIMARLFMKKKFIEQAVPAGFQIGSKDRAKLVPPDSVTTEEGLAALEAAIARLTNESERADHPVFGRLTNQEWTKFHLRHAEMHLSFVRPA